MASQLLLCSEPEDRVTRTPGPTCVLASSVLGYRRPLVEMSTPPGPVDRVTRPSGCLCRVGAVDAAMCGAEGLLDSHTEHLLLFGQSGRANRCRASGPTRKSGGYMEGGPEDHLFPWGRRDCMTDGLDSHRPVRLLTTDLSSGGVLGRPGQACDTRDPGRLREPPVERAPYSAPGGLLRSPGRRPKLLLGRQGVVQGQEGPVSPRRPSGSCREQHPPLAMAGGQWLAGSGTSDLPWKQGQGHPPCLGSGCSAWWRASPLSLFPLPFLILLSTFL